MQKGDIITFWTDSDTLPHLWSKIGLRPANETFELSIERHLHHLVEVVISPKNPATGKTISQIHADKSSFFGGSLVALSRGGKPVISQNDTTVILQGDNAILEVQDEFFYENRNEKWFKLIRRLQGYHIKRTDRAAEATLITACMVIVALQWLPLINAALLAVFAMLLTGCMSINHAVKSVDLKTITILACAVGLESALTETGLSGAIAKTIESASGTDPYLALAAIFIGSIIMTNIITNPAAAAFMFPIAYNLAADIGVSFMPFVIVLMLGCSYAFINPAGYQTNMMVYEPGGYSTRDYIRTGFPLTIIVGAITLLLTPVFFPFAG